MSVSQKLDNNFHCDIAYRGLLFYHRLTHGSEYTCDTYDRLVEPHCFIFLQGLLTFSIYVKHDTSLAQMSLLQIKRFPTL